MRNELEPTPGPWATDYRKTPGGYAQEVFDSRGQVIATCAWYPVQVSDTTTATNREANGRLIAAAPDLLDALQRMLGAARMAECYDEYQAAEAAIAKAVHVPPNDQGNRTNPRSG